LKRTAEFTLGIIGTIISGLMSLLGMFLIWTASSDEVRAEVEKQVQDDPMMVQEDIDVVLGLFSTGGWAIIIASIIGIIFGIIAIISIKGNKNPKLAGWMYIVGGVLVGIISLGLGFLPALLFIIAGIMCFVRKQPAEPTAY